MSDVNAVDFAANDEDLYDKHMNLVEKPKPKAERAPRTMRTEDLGYVAIKQKIASFPKYIREFAVEKLANKKTREEITKALKNRAEYVPQIAHYYEKTEDEVNLALDVLATIRRLHGS